MKNRIIITATFAACLALCAAVWPQAETVGETPTPSETTAVIAPQPTLPEAEKPVLPVVTEKKETEMPETKSAPETTTEELPVPAPEIEDEPVAEQKSAPPTQTDPTPVQPAQLEPKTAPESMVWITGRYPSTPICSGARIVRPTSATPVTKPSAMRSA